MILPRWAPVDVSDESNRRTWRSIPRIEPTGPVCSHGVLSMQVNLITCAVRGTLPLVLALLGARGPAGDCDECNLPGNMLHLPTSGLAKTMRGYKNPAVPPGLFSAIPTTPLSFDVKVRRDGVLCGVTVVRRLDPSLSTICEAAIRQCSFRTVSAGGHRVCYTGRLFFYVRGTPRRPAIIVPGVTDHIGQGGR